MRFRLTVDDVLLLAVVVALLYFRNWWAALVFVVVLAYLIYHYSQAKKKDSSADTNEFLIDRDDMSHASAELDVDISYRPAPNHFRIDENFDSRYTDSEYEFRIDGTGAGGTKVFARLIALKTMDIMEKEHYQVRDGVVLETDMRQMDEGHTLVLKDLTEDRIKNLKGETEWFEMKTNARGGLVGSWCGHRRAILRVRHAEPFATL